MDREQDIRHEIVCHYRTDDYLYNLFFNMISTRKRKRWTVSAQQRVWTLPDRKINTKFILMFNRLLKSLDKN